ncbi:PKD domain-containing protein [Candidatus Gottesmanbacteria bacterium]|nr:PKD domain-containing protein [Candidatus Gottesmanbacteria bacterium]
MPTPSYTSSCTDLAITGGNETLAPTTASFSVSGYDPFGTIKRYKVDFGNGSSQESDANVFTSRYEAAGSYTVRGYMLDSHDNWRGGDGACQKTLFIRTTTMTTQPKTGNPTIVTLAAVLSGALIVISQRKKTH